MKVFFQLFGQRKDIEQMFDEEEPKKEKPIDLDDLSVEEIEKMIKEHQQEIEMLSLLLEKKKEKLKLALAAIAHDTRNLEVVDAGVIVIDRSVMSANVLLDSCIVPV